MEEKVKLNIVILRAKFIGKLSFHIHYPDFAFS